MLYKKCRICEDMKEVSEFHKKRSTKDGYRNECKECVKDIQKKYKEAPGFKEKQAEYDKKRYEEKREEILEHKKEYYQDNKEDILKQKSEYRQKPEEILEHKKEYYQDNKEDILKQKSEYRQKPENRQRNNDYGKIYRVENREKFYKHRRDNPHIIAWRSILYSTLKRLNTSKQSSTIDELGYSALELKDHIEKQFTEGMNWDNHGEWHIDHIKGVINFDSDTEVSIVCALDNLQPLWSTTREIDGVVYEGNLNKGKFL